METAVRVGTWIERELDRVRPERIVLMFFGGEPLLNLPVMYYLAERTSRDAAARCADVVTMITNGLLLTPEIVDRLVPYGLNGVKITLDGDSDTHNRMRPLRGGQGTFDRIVENVRQVAGKSGSRSAATSTRARSTAFRRCSTFSARRTSRTSW